jgi:hypothetical protein
MREWLCVRGCLCVCVFLLRPPVPIFAPVPVQVGSSLSHAHTHTHAHAHTHTRLLLLGRTQVISGFVAAMKFSQLIGPGACVLVGTRRVLVSTRRLSPCRNSGVVALQPLRRCVAAIMAQGCATWRRCYMVQQ